VPVMKKQATLRGTSKKSGHGEQGGGKNVDMQPDLMSYSIAQMPASQAGIVALQMRRLVSRNFKRDADVRLVDPDCKATFAQCAGLLCERRLNGVWPERYVLKVVGTRKKVVESKAIDGWLKTSLYLDFK